MEVRKTEEMRRYKERERERERERESSTQLFDHDIGPISYIKFRP